MSIAINILSAVLKSVVNSKMGNELANDIIGISIDGISEKGINMITDYIDKKKTKINFILSKENMESMNIPEENIDYVVAEIKGLLSKVKITDEMFRQCKYDDMKLSVYLWDEYRVYKDGYIECENDIKKVLFIVADALIKLLREGEQFEQNFLIQISNSVDDTNAEIQKISDFMQKNFNKLDSNYQEILIILHNIFNKIQNANKQDRKQEVKSRTQEYADKWNRNMFLNDFDKRDEKAGVNVKLCEVYLETHLPNYVWNNNYKQSSDLKDLIFEQIKNEKNQMLLILGQPGIGKSTLITWITANFMSYIDKILVYQFASDLRNVQWHNLNEGYDVVEDMLKTMNLSYDELYGKTLIIDGFDEINVESDRTKILNQFYWKLVKANTLKNFSLIITCRENYIQDLNKLACNYITLQPWDRDQIKSFCDVYRKKTNCIISENTMAEISENISILGIPLILYMSLALNTLIEKEGGIVDIYDQIFSLDGGIYDRCIENDRYESSHRIAEIKEQIHQISREIAIWMFENNSDEAYIPQREYEKICFAIMQEGKNVEQDFMIGNFFRLVRHCEGIDTERLFFVHRSIYEYFVVEYIFASICREINSSRESIASVCGMLLKGNKLSVQMLKFLQHKISNSILNEQFDIINETFQLMLQDGMTYYTYKSFKNVIICEMNVFCNMLEIIHLWREKRIKFGNSITKYLNYNSIYKFNLTNADLFGVDLSGSDLGNVDLSGANLLNEEI